MDTSTSTQNNTSSNARTLVLPEGTFYYTPTQIYHESSNTFIPANHYYNPETGATVQATTTMSTGGSGTTSGTVSTGTGSTPGAPNTGLGGESSILWFSMIISIAVIGFASVYLFRNVASYR